MKKGLIVLLGLLMCLTMLPVSAFVENDSLGEVRRPNDLAGGYDTYEVIDLDAIKEPEYNDSLILEVNKLIEGENSGASAKVYMLVDTCMRIFIEVTDSELIDPTQEQQIEEAASMSFDSIELIFDRDNGDHSVSPWFRDNPDDDDGSWPWNLEQSTLRSYRMDHTGFVYNEWMDDGHQWSKEWIDSKKALDEEWELSVGKNALYNKEDGNYYYFESGFEWNPDEKFYHLPDSTEPLDFSVGEKIPTDKNNSKYFSNNDFIGWGNSLIDSLKPLQNDDSSFAAVRKTETGYNVEIFAMWPEYGGGTEMGLNIILTDVYDGGEKKAVYTLNGETDVMDWKTYDYFVIDEWVADPKDDEGNVLDADGRAAYIAAQKGETVDTSGEDTGADTGADTSTDTAKTTDTKSVDNNKDDGGMNPVIIGVIIAVVVIAVVVVIVVVMKKKKTE